MNQSAHSSQGCRFPFLGATGPLPKGENDMLQNNHETASPPNSSSVVEIPPRRLRAEPQRRAADPNLPDQVADGLLTYLKRRYGVGALRYRSVPISNPDGWETHTYNFQLEGPSLPAFPASDRPL